MPLLSIKLKNKNKSNNIHLYMSTRIRVMEKQWCDNDCGEELIDTNYYPITHLKHGIATENKGGSAVLCPSCYVEYNKMEESK